MNIKPRYLLSVNLTQEDAERAEKALFVVCPQTKRTYNKRQVYMRGVEAILTEVSKQS